MSDASPPLGRITIAPRFCGPPATGNGGYVAGRLASFLEGPVAVRLHAATPLGVALDVCREDDRISLRNGETMVAQARPAEVAIEPPEPPTFADAEAAARRFRGFDEHVFPGCFVCGIHREEGDGLRLFPGALDGRPLVACPWTPDASLGTPGEPLPLEFVWAALDCPGAFAFPQVAGACLLGELAVAATGSVSVGERCVVVAWNLDHQGRKHYTGSALFDASGALRGLALGTWIEVATR